MSISSENRILENLRFQNLFGREDGIKNATDGTSCWLLQGKDLVLNDTDNGSNGDFQPEGSTHQQLKEKTEFTQWLKSGCGIFHISGKAGSGKSTLMKKIWMEPQTRECLKQWAGDRELLYAAFFFWNIGNDNQKSLTGLHRSILFSVLNKRPNLIPEVFPLLWNKNQTVLSVNLIKLTRPPIIEKAFETLMNKAMGGDFCLCLFIDGLDEYDADSEDHWKLAKRLRDWASHSHGNIKICVSSRPHIQFNRTFSSNRLNQHQVHLQYLNRPDIELHCRTMFTKDEDFKELNTLQENCEALTKEIVDRAEGVFLWAVLVVRIILSEARRYGTGDDLMRKLDQLPRDMDRLYDRIIESLSPADRIIANRILYVVLTNPFSQEVNALSLKWLVEKHGQQTTHPNTTYTMDDAEKHITYVKNHLDGWTKGLIETNSTRHYDIPKSLRPALTTRVKFLHRTLTEYLLQPERLQQLRNSYSEINLADLHAHLRLEGLKYFVEIDPKLIKVHCKSLQDFQTSIWNYGRQIFGMKCHKSMPNEENFNSQQISWPLIEKLAKVIPSSLNVSAFQTTLTYEHGEIYPTGYDPSDQASPLHLAASLGHRSILTKGIQLQADMASNTSPTKKSLLLSASLSHLCYYSFRLSGSVPSETLVKFLLKQGCSAREMIRLGNRQGTMSAPGENANHCASVWMVLVTYLLDIEDTGLVHNRLWNSIISPGSRVCRIGEIIKILGIILHNEPQEEILILCRRGGLCDSFLTLEDLIRICSLNIFGGACKLPVYEQIMDGLKHWPKYESGSRSSEHAPTWLWDVAYNMGEEMCISDKLENITADRYGEILHGHIGLYAVVSRTVWLKRYEDCRGWFMMW